jgi:hypothetical protein
MESIFYYFLFPLIVSLTAYFVFAAYKAVNESLDKKLIKEPTKVYEKSDYITISRTELKKVIDKNNLLESILLESIDNYKKEKSSLNAIISISDFESRTNQKRMLNLYDENLSYETQTEKYSSINN